MKRWIFILTITFSVVQISDGIFGRSRSWNVPTRPRDPFDTPRWCYRQKPLGESEDYDELTTTPYPHMNNHLGPAAPRFPKIGLSCFCGSSSSENDVEYDGNRCKHHKKKKPEKKPDKKKDKRHKKHHGPKKDDNYWAPRVPVGYELPSTNDICY